LEDITFSLADDSLGFSIDASTGVVTTNTDFAADYENTQSQSFTVVATDGAGNASEQVVSVAINNLDEVAPSITSGDTGTAVNENSGADQVVYTATASDTDFNGLEDITFSLADESLGFSIDADTGVVTTNADFAADYENTQSQSFTVVATDVAGNASEQVVNVAINNLDEVAPVINSGDTATAIDENSGEGQVVYTATASDTDFNGAEDITFSLADDSLGFSIDAATGVVTTNTDFESNFEDAQSQSFTVVATDAAGNASEQVVSVAINNLDEVAPSITSGDTGTAVNENSGADQVVYTATASDTDFNGAEDITFSLADDSLGFSIDAATGVVTTNADFAADYENTQSQSFTVVATDAAGNASEQEVSLEINNLDDTAPIIMSGSTAIAIDENSGADQVVYTATAYDSFDVSDTPITFSLAAGSDPALIIDSLTGDVKLTTDPDYEAQSSYSFAVVATDAAGNESEAQSVTLTINDLDDAAPTITSGDTAVTIDENSGSGQVVYTATADDSADDVSDTPITFSLSSDSDVALSIDSATGEVTLSTDPDHEAQSSYSFAVIATDAAGNESEAQSVILEINDLDDAAPTITSGDTAITIDENSGSGQVVYTATADDSLDDVADSPITFSLSDSSDTALSIDSATGEVTLLDDPDHETQSSYSFAVIATDAAGNESFPQSVTLDINNLDEVAPSIDSGDTATAVDENSGEGQVVYTATASDTDFNDLEDITFSLADDSLGFSIDASTGVVTTNTDFAADYENTQSQSFTVVATDGAGNASEQVVSVAINNLDEVAPSITSGDTGTAVNENSGADQVVYTATASDTDFNGLEDITFSLADESLGFSIDADTGVVTTNADFAADYENTQSQSFTVVATDVAGNASEQVVNVAINNLDEVAPVINSGDTATAIDENSGEGQVVYTATASDTDFNGAEDITFSLADDSLGFSIDAATGVVTTNTDFESNFEDAQSQSFTVVATDAAGNASEQVVNVAINNLDEVAPSITSGDTGTAVNENSGADQVVYTATADDSADTSDGFLFSLADDSLGFSIDASTGVVTTNADFAADYENTQSQSFTVVATDAAGNATEQEVSLEINNLDEVAPVINSGDTATAIDENSGEGQVVYTATASDTDFNGAEDITFSLADDSLGFSIDASTGVVTTTADFAANYEDAQSQSFTVVATDAAGNASEQVVSVAINNLDEVAPFITSSATAIAIDENLGADQVVYTATAYDSADTSDGVTFSLVGTDAAAFSIDNDSGEVTLIADADYEVQSQFSFTIVATDGAGNASSKLVSLAINNLDEVAPSITSGDTATAIDENSGEGQVVYTATATDDTDTSDGFSFSLADNSLGFSINADTGVVTTNADFVANHEDAQSQSFTVVATDVAGNASEQVVSVAINNLDEVAPSITSGDTATAIDENSGPGQVVYTAVANDSSDISDGVIFSLADDSLGFSIDASTGVVTTNADFVANHEDAQSQSFTVVATDVAGNASEQVVSVAINNLDEIAPSIDSGDTAVAIDENSGEGQVVYTATASDTDFNDLEDITFSLADEALGFSIDASTGVVTTNADFVANHEDAQSQSFTVVATDVAGNASEQVVNVAINNLDEVAPTITSGETASVFESSGAGALVYRAIMNDAADISAGVTFTLSEGHDPALSINNVTGEVTLADEPDFATKPSYSFTVIADDGVNESQKAVVLSVVDEDLEAPVFTSSAAVAIDENIGENQVIYTAVTEDESLVTYSLSDNDTDLSVNLDTGAVTLATNPDHESQSEYSFTVIATDIANNVSQQAVYVSVNDLDDAAPTITSGATAIAIDENSGSSQVIYTASANDTADVSDGVTFSLTSDSDPALSIDALTGKVTLTSDPDYETQSQYSFAVIATDAAGNESDVQSVTLDINNFDDAAPSITSGDTATAIDENSGASQVVYTATANDSGDEVSDTPITFSLTSDSDTALSIDPSTGAVTLSDDPDHEAQSSYNFAVIATDAAGNESNAQSVTLNVNDLDDAAPTITSDATATSIDENSGAGQVIYTATADDSSDDVSDTPITFSLADGSDIALSIDSLTGEVTLSSDPDYEVQASYNFDVIATDAAGNQSDAHSVTLDINNIDEVPPVFTSSNAADVVEGNESGDVVYTASTEDEADISSGIIEYSLVQGDLLDSALEINQATGEVTLNEVADYEAKPSYTFTVVATDTINKGVAQQVTLNVINIDDTAPLITSEATASIDENSGAGLVVYQAIADDSADVSEGVSFSLLDENLGFTINSETGVVTTNSDFSADFEAQGGQSQSFTVVATDVAGNSTEKQITVSINDIDESAPVITSGNSAASIDENTDAGQVVYSATSNETGVLFSLSEDTDANLFAINSTSGAVTFKRSPDFEDQNSFSFEVIATDAAGNVSETQPVTLSINNVDDRAPEFTSSTVGNAIDENAETGVVVYDANAIDTDFAGDEVITFSLADEGLGFSIDANGIVTTNGNFVGDYQEAQSQSFTVVATDGAGNVTEQVVTVAINEIDEVAPTITSADTTVAIDENSGAGQVIYTATATDTDFIGEEEITFSLAQGSDAALTIDSQTGAVTLSTNPDHETQSAYSFAVVATDAAGNESDAQSVMLTINDLDDAAPTITSGSTATSIEENSGAGQVIYTATADDSGDDVSDTPIRFTLAEGSDNALSIDTSTGAVTLSANPDHESQSEYNFTVVATDGAGNASEKLVSLAINNLDEVAPSITSGDTATAIDENSGEGQVVYTATATDDADTSDGFSFSLADDSLGFSIDADTGVVTTNANFAADYENARVTELYRSCYGCGR
jgi:hypothetical protein